MISARKLKISSALIVALFFVGGVRTASGEAAYRSPYEFKTTVPVEELRAVDRKPPRDNPKLEASIPVDLWYSDATKKKFGAWGPRPRNYPLIDGFETLTPSWKRQRVLAVAQGLIGLPYQHHHIPDWEPPQDWPWKTVAYGKNSKGLDCSNFTSWAYNYGLGIQINSNVKKQAAMTEVKGPDGEKFPAAKVILDDKGFDDLVVNKLKSGDLLFIKREESDDISHVIMWVGEFGKSPDGDPLIIDCTGSSHQDCSGNKIPIGVQLRPFTKDSWYYRRFSHANRLILEGKEQQ